MKTTSPSREHLLAQFSDAIEDLNAYASRNKNSLTEKQSLELIASFEASHEMALRVINSYLATMGKGPFSGSRDATVEAFHAELIDDGKGWLDMVIDRIQYSPVYDLENRQQFISHILDRYVGLLGRFEDRMKKKMEE
ncbi:nucleotidyltransferase substrate binding protein [Algoriphagus sp. H41]|uniref:Nucleotidyltransferase substrate binding protein n=1 Tax=Algoriphagus oliviformis TaxID=2811231 RepID=A0ABS3C893_9BACT|nr:nucleotidyltransferase substrate binding protein [Algoriphagus oliviformis]MBN7812386.1 nucleotidyltransferase substrate binding protein [Algoriphagus oliviformis]